MFINDERLNMIHLIMYILSKKVIVDYSLTKVYKELKIDVFENLIENPPVIICNN